MPVWAVLLLVAALVGVVLGVALAYTVVQSAAAIVVAVLDRA
jgi:hypothetical protein